MQASPSLLLMLLKTGESATAAGALVRRDTDGEVMGSGHPFLMGSAWWRLPPCAASGQGAASPQRWALAGPWGQVFHFVLASLAVGPRGPAEVAGLTLPDSERPQRALS